MINTRPSSKGQLTPATPKATTGMGSAPTMQAAAVKSIKAAIPKAIKRISVPKPTVAPIKTDRGAFTLKMDS